MRFGHAITSLGVQNGLGADLVEVTARLRRGESAIVSETPFPKRNPKPFPMPLARVRSLPGPPWEPLAGWGHGTLPATRQDLLAMAGLAAVIADVRAAVERHGASRVAVILGTSTGGIEASERAYQTLLSTGALPAGFSCHEHHALDAAARHVQGAVGATGPMYAVSAACSSSAKALAAAGRLIDADLADAVLVAGVDSLCLTTLLGFHGLGVVDPRGCRPFAADRAGMNVGEGAAFLLLERDADGEVYFVAAGETGDAHHMAHPDPAGEGAERAIRAALDAAELDASEVGYVNAHGTGTWVNDDAEARVLARVFGRGPRVTSTKGSSGHLLGASGATEAVFSVEALRSGVAPGNGGWETPPLGIDILPAATPLHADFALSNSFAFGGSNASLVFAHRRAATRWATRAPAARWDAFELVRVQKLIPNEGGAEGFGGQLLSSRALGRASTLTRLFAHVLWRMSEEGADVRRLPLVFASGFGEMQTTLELLELQATRGESSPLRFQVSVHNAAQGLLSIATGHRGFATTLSAGKQTFTMALIEAMAFLRHSGEEEVLVLVAEEGASPLSAVAYDALAVGLHLRASRAPSGPWLGLPHLAATRPARQLQLEPERAALGESPISDALRLCSALETGEYGSLPLCATRVEASWSEPRWCVDLHERPA